MSRPPELDTPDRTTYLGQFMPGNGRAAAPGAQNGNGPGNNPGNNPGGNNSGLPGGNGQGGVFISPTVRFVNESTDRLHERRLDAIRSIPAERNLFSD
jgi:hypothetical protein